MVSSSHSPTSQLGAPSSLTQSHSDAPDAPNTPSSSAHAQQHRKTSSLSSASPRAAAKAAARSFSLRHSQVQALTEEQLRALRGEDKKEGSSSSIMVIAPENLPPSPPLTSQDTDGDADVDTEEAVDGASRTEPEEDVADAWRHRSSVKRSMDVVTDDQHPLTPKAGLEDGYSGDAGVDLDRDLEKGHAAPDQPRHSIEVDIADHTGVTKPFEVVRKPRPPTSPKPPHSSYYVGPPTGSTAYYSAPRGQLGVHHPREIVRVERDYDHGELVQFSSSYPLELQGRITPTQFLETVNALNEGLIRAHSLGGACLDNTLAVLTLWVSTLVLESRYDREMRRLQQLVDALNAELYNPQGLNILWPRKCAFLFLEIEYY